jgi:hypothetical protein
LAVSDLPQPWHAQQEHAARRGQAEVARAFAPRFAPFAQPIFEAAQSADIGKVRTGFVKLQRARLADDLLFLVQHDVDVAFIERAVHHQCLVENVGRFISGEAQSGLHQLLARGIADVDLHAGMVLHTRQQFAQQFIQFFSRGRS